MSTIVPPLNQRNARVGVVWLAGLVTLGSLVGCGTFNNASGRVAGIVSPYKIDIVQGNFVSKEQADALKVGMTRVQVRDLLGTPLLASMFHADRWDYVFTFKRQGTEPQARKVSVYFSGDALARFEADVLPTETEFVATLDSGRRFGKVPVLEASEESLAKFAPEAKVKLPGEADAKALPPLPASYPPLEPASR